MKTLELKLKQDGKPIKVHLRLTARGQLNLKEEYNEEILATMMTAIDDIEKCIKVFDEALHYKNNDNVIEDGEELYDLLVDNETTGSSGIGKVLTDIAINSGIISKQQANSIVKAIKKTEDAIYGRLTGENVEKVIEFPVEEQTEEEPEEQIEKQSEGQSEEQTDTEAAPK